MDQQIETFLRALKQYGIKKNIPNISPQLGKFLNNLVKILNCQNILEIGCANGYSTIWMAEAMDKNKGKMVVIDRSLPSLKAVKNNLAQFSFSSLIELIEGDAVHILPKFKQKFDLIFVDAQKNLYAQFWELAKNLLEKNGIIIFDNVRKFPEKTQDFWRLIENQSKFEYLEIPQEKDAVVMLW
jgi:predicted O-methyltransferase YrrM